MADAFTALYKLKQQGCLNESHVPRKANRAPGFFAWGAGNMKSFMNRPTSSSPVGRALLVFFAILLLSGLWFLAIF